MAEEFFWIDAEGTSHDLSSGDDNVKVGRPVSGRFMPDTNLIEDETPGQPGVQVREAEHEAGYVTLPLKLRGTSDVSLRDNLRVWLHRLNVLRGAGRIRVTGHDAGQREVTCYYLRGLGSEFEEGVEKFSHRHHAVVVFRTTDPYWYDVSPVVQSFTLDTEPLGFFDGPWFPFSLTASEVFAESSVNNDGDVEAWPVWTITGPGSSILLENVTTGKRLGFSTVLAGGETITIDTRRDQLSITKNDGSNLFTDLTADRALWPLERGLNAVRLEMASATAESQIDLSHTRRRLGA